MRWAPYLIAVAGAAVLQPPVLCAAEAPDAGATRAPDRLRVGTVNMWGIPRVSTYIDERFAALAQRVLASDLDLVGLQEVWADGPRHALRRAVAARFPHQADFQSDDDAGGLLILSRFPIVERHFTPFPVNGKPWKPWHGDWWGDKGVGLVRLDTPGGPLWFGTTHLHARYRARPPGGDEMDDQYAYDRWHQIHTVLEVVSRHAGAAPAIVVGDFNFTRASGYHRLVRGAVVPAWAGWLDAAGDGGDGRIDYVWLRPGVATSWQVRVPPQQVWSEPVVVADGPPQALTDHPALAATVSRVAATPDRAWTADAGPETPELPQLGGVRLWVKVWEAGHAGELAVILAGACFVCACGVLVLPRRPAALPAPVRVTRAIVGAALFLLGFGIARGAYDVARARAAGYAFWRATRPTADADSSVPDTHRASPSVE